MGEALMQIDKDDLRRLSLIEGRPIAIEMVMACIKTIVSPDNCLPSDLTWTKTRTMLVQPAHATEVTQPKPIPLNQTASIHVRIPRRLACVRACTYVRLSLFVHVCAYAFTCVCAWETIFMHVHVYMCASVVGL